MIDKKNIIILGLFVWIVLLFTCNGGGKDPIIKEVVTTRVDSFNVVTHTIDTFDTVIYVPYAVVPEIVPENTNPDLMDLSDTSVFNTEVQTFYYGNKDSLLNYNIRVYSSVKPEMLEMEYNLLSRTIKTNTHDSTYIRDSTNTKEIIKKSFLSAGAMLSGGNSDLGFAPMLTYSHKKGNNYSLGYDILNQRVMVGFTKKISFK